MIVRYLGSGSEIQTTENDHEGYPPSPIEPLFGFAHIIENHQMDMCVSTKRDESSTVVFVDKEGQLRFRYGSDDSRKNPFYSRRLTVNKRSCIFVDNSGNNCHQQRRNSPIVDIL